MDTVILNCRARSFHHNKSQRKDPFIVLSCIIAGKAKYVKDLFSTLILHEASNTKALGGLYDFWEKWGNTRTNGKREKTKGAEDALGKICPDSTLILPDLAQRDQRAGYCQLRCRHATPAGSLCG